MEIMHKSETSNHPEKKFMFSCFVKSVIKLSTRKKSTKFTDAELVGLTVKKYFVPLSEKRATRDVTSELEESASLRDKFLPCVKDSFQFFAKHPSNYELDDLKRHERRPDMNHMTQSLGFHDFQSICSCFNLSAGVGVALTAMTATQLAFAFYDAHSVKCKDIVGGLTVEEFWEVLVR